MKPLSELVKELRGQRKHTGVYAHAADLVQAWLREADKQVKGWRLIRLDDVDASKAIFRELRKDFRAKLLGTTQEGSS